MICGMFFLIFSRTWQKWQFEARPKIRPGFFFIYGDFPIKLQQIWDSDQEIDSIKKKGGGAMVTQTYSIRYNKIKQKLKRGQEL